MSRPLQLVSLCGSLRQGSFNAAMARALPELAPAGVTVTPLAGLGELPLYDGDVEAAGLPAVLGAMGAAIAAADGVVLVTPEYNYSIPGVLKNGLDWLSRLSPAPFAGKPVAIQGGSMGGFGTARMQHHLRQVLVALDALVLPKPEVMVPLVQQKVSDTGVLTDEKTRAAMAKQLEAFCALVRRLQG